MATTADDYVLRFRTVGAHDVQGMLSQLEQRIPGLSHLFEGLGVAGSRSGVAISGAFAVAVASAAKAMISAAVEANKFERAILRINAKAGRELIDVAERMGRTTIHSGEVWKEVGKNLLALGLDSGKAAALMGAMGNAVDQVGGSDENLIAISKAIGMIAEDAGSAGRQLRMLTGATKIPIYSILREGLGVDETGDIKITNRNKQQAIDLLITGMEKFGAGASRKELDTPEGQAILAAHEIEQSLEETGKALLVALKPISKLAAIAATAIERLNSTMGGGAGLIALAYGVVRSWTFLTAAMKAGKEALSGLGAVADAARGGGGFGGYSMLNPLPVYVTNWAGGVPMGGRPAIGDAAVGAAAGYGAAKALPNAGIIPSGARALPASVSSAVSAEMMNHAMESWKKYLSDYEKAKSQGRLPPRDFGVGSGGDYGTGGKYTKNFGKDAPKATEEKKQTDYLKQIAESTKAVAHGGTRAKGFASEMEMQRAVAAMMANGVG